MGTTRIGFVLFPRMTQLDLTGPYEMLARVPGAEVLLLAKDGQPVETELGLRILPSASLAESPPLDLICVPGGPGVNALLEDDAVLDFLAARGARARWVTSVCTGALALGAAGLLRGYRATTHWLSLDLLPIFGATPVAERVVIDRNRITGGGVTAGIDFGLRVAAELAGEAQASEIALLTEYDPAPPFHGSPRTAAPEVVASVRGSREGLQAARQRLCEAAVARRAVGQEASARGG